LPTELYNETWMLRLVLHWFGQEKNRGKTFENMPIKMYPNSKWFSEGRIKTEFKNERHTHADGIYGKITIGEGGFSNVKLAQGCRQFVVTEAKMYSQFSEGIKNHGSYNQAARNIVCMCHIAKDVIHEIDDIDIAFYTILPIDQKKGVAGKSNKFVDFTNREHINKTVRDRIEKYKDNSAEYERLNKWYESDFTPFCEKEIKIDLISWEEIIEAIQKDDSIYGAMLEDYYKKCEKYNQKNKRTGIKDEL